MYNYFYYMKQLAHLISVYDNVHLLIYIQVRVDTSLNSIVSDVTDLTTSVAEYNENGKTSTSKLSLGATITKRCNSTVLILYLLSPTAGAMTLAFEAW